MPQQITMLSEQVPQVIDALQEHRNDEDVLITKQDNGDLVLSFNGDLVLSFSLAVVTIDPSGLTVVD